MKHYIAIIVSFMLITSCANKRVTLPLKPISEPPLNEVFTTHLGERMLMQSFGYYTDIINVESTELFSVNVARGGFCKIPGSDRYISFNNRAIGLKNAFGGIVGYTSQLEYDSADDEVCIDGTITLCYDKQELPFHITKNRLCSDPSRFQQIIEYNGLEGNILRFTYREFTSGRMHAPYTTNFSMDFSKGNEVTYKGARLQIVEATNQSITYRVLKNFNDAIS